MEDFEIAVDVGFGLGRVFEEDTVGKDCGDEERVVGVSSTKSGGTYVSARYTPPAAARIRISVAM